MTRSDAIIQNGTQNSKVYVIYIDQAIGQFGNDRDHCSENQSWNTLRGSMPRGSKLGPLSFVVMIDNLKAKVHKFVDDTTLS